MNPALLKNRWKNDSGEPYWEMARRYLIAAPAGSL
jgi:hypothetical protein